MISLLVNALLLTMLSFSDDGPDPNLLLATSKSAANLLSPVSANGLLAAIPEGPSMHEVNRDSGSGELVALLIDDEPPNDSSKNLDV